MNIFDIHHSMAVATALDPQQINSDTTTNGNIIDTAGYEALEFVIYSKTVTDGTYTASLQEGDDSGLSDAAAVDSDEVLGSAVFAAADDNEVKRIGYIGKKRYVRLDITSASTSTGVDILGAAAIKGSARSQPVAD